MASKKNSYFCKGDIVRTSPEQGFYGIAVVLDDGCRLPIPNEEGKFSTPMCHIAITPLLFDYEITMEDIDVSMLKPLIFIRHYLLDSRVIPYREETMIHIYSTRNILNLPIIGKVDPKSVFQGDLSWEPQQCMFHWCGEAGSLFGREAFNYWQRNNQDISKKLSE